MKVEYDEGKRSRTLIERELDMADAGQVFDGEHLTAADTRKDYGEERFSTVGFLDGRMVFVIWTQREDAVRVISMRKANEREQRHFSKLFGI